MQNAFFKSAGLCLAMLGLAACSGNDDESVEMPSEPGKYLHIGRDSVQIFVVRPGETFADRGQYVAGKLVFEKCGDAFIESAGNKPARGVLIPHVPPDCLLQQHTYYTELK